MSDNSNSCCHLAEWLKDKNPALFYLSENIRRGGRLLKRHPLAAFSVGTIFFGLAAAPMLISAFASYAGYFWFAAGLLSFLGATVLGMLFVSKEIYKFANQESIARQVLQSEILFEVHKLSTKNEELSSEHDQLSAKHDQLMVKHEQLMASLEKISNNPIFNISDYQSFNRKLKKDHIDVLMKDWAGRLALNLTPKSLSYLAHRICTMEIMSKGRLATPIENAVLRVLVAAAVKSKDLHVLEIGTLFGLGLTMIYDYCRPRFDSVQLTAIDPLDGYYGTDLRDIITNEPINELTFRHNLTISGVVEDEYTLIKALSTDAAAIESTPKAFYDLFIIDGDHSYEGVKADYINYLACVKTGGFIIFDDYGSPEWPGVQKFVDEEVLNSADLTFVGAAWRSAVFRVK